MNKTLLSNAPLIDYSDSTLNIDPKYLWIIAHTHAHIHTQSTLNNQHQLQVIYQTAWKGNFS